jgi:hypothetical protein
MNMRFSLIVGTPALQSKMVGAQVLPSLSGRESMTARFLRHFFAGLLACSLLTIPASAQGNGHGNGKGKGHDKKDKGDDEDRGGAKYQFRSQDREFVTTYYSKHGSGLPPGLAKRNGDLPPGLEKQLQRNGTLPPGLQKKLQPCPVEITRQLPPLPPDYRRNVIGASIVVFNVRTNIVVDVMHDVVR